MKIFLDGKKNLGARCTLQVLSATHYTFIHFWRGNEKFAHCIYILTLIKEQLFF